MRQDSLNNNDRVCISDLLRVQQPNYIRVRRFDVNFSVLDSPLGSFSHC